MRRHEPKAVRAPFPKLLTWLCGVFVHKDVNWSDGTKHYAYCRRCGKIFGNPWSDPSQYLTPEQYERAFPKRSQQTK